MLIVALFVLSAVKVNGEAVDQDGLKKSRQLDFDLQDINPIAGKIPTNAQQSTSPKNDVIGTYLPPASSSEFTSAQSQQAFEFKSINSIEKEDKLCKSPFENCNLKENSTSDYNIPKPSRDLVPPFNDLEKELHVREKVHLEETNKQKIITSTDYQNVFITTTEKIATKTSRRTPTQNTVGSVTTTLAPQEVVNKAEPANELRNYLPPQSEFSAAAQTNVAVIQPVNQNQNHDHHHHGNDFNICADAFHSFLCAPLKARKRITGALPESLKSQNSFINYQKSLLNFDRETAPSNTFRNEYLPPNTSPTNLFQSSYLPPLTSKRPVSTTTTTPYSLKFSNSIDRFHFPQMADNKVQNPSFIKPALSNQEHSTVTPSATSSPVTFSKATSTIASNSLFQKISPAQNFSNPSSSNAVAFNSVTSNENKFYLPPNPNFQPSASVISTSQNIFPIASTFSSRTATFVPLSTFSTFAPLPTVSTVEPLPTVSTVAPLPANSIFVSQKSKAQPISTLTTTVKTPIYTTTPKPIIQLSSFAAQSSKSSNIFLPLASKFPSSFTTTTKPLTSTFKYSEQSSNTGGQYLPPDFKAPAAAQISSAAVAAPQAKNPFHHGRDLCTDPFHSFLCTSAKPRKRITGQVPVGFKPESSNIDESRLKPVPSSQDENKVRPDKFIKGAPIQNLEYKNPKPINPLPTSFIPVIYSTSQSSYSYSKPDRIFPLPSQETVKFTSAISSAISKKPESTLNPSEARVVLGYQYPKPDKVLPHPEEEENAKVVTTTSLPTTGYSYPRPQKQFPLPTEQKEIVQKLKQKATTSFPSSTSPPISQVKGYQYPKPDHTFKLPEKKGYLYPKPEKRLELPNENRSKFLLPQSTSSLDSLKNVGSVDFIPVNKIDYKRAEPSKLLVGLRRFGERMKKREKQSELLKRQLQ